MAGAPSMSCASAVVAALPASTQPSKAATRLGLMRSPGSPGLPGSAIVYRLTSLGYAAARGRPAGGNPAGSRAVGRRAIDDGPGAGEDAVRDVIRSDHL